jgi:hypothetical protein
LRLALPTGDSVKETPLDSAFSDSAERQLPRAAVSDDETQRHAAMTSVVMTPFDAKGAAVAPAAGGAPGGVPNQS